MNVDCTGIPKEKLLAYIYTFSGNPLESILKIPLSQERAKAILEENLYIGRLGKRSINIDFSKYPHIRPELFDRDNGGSGTFARIVRDFKNNDVV